MGTTIRYHVAGPRYAGGSLHCWDALVAAEIIDLTDWQWEDAPLGYDGDVVCVFSALDDARDHLAAVADGSRILVIAVPGEGDQAWEECYPGPLGYGLFAPERTTVDEGYEAIRGGVPAEWIVGEAA